MQVSNRASYARSAVLCAIVWVHGAACTGPAVPSDGGESCTTDLDCEDGHECTIDSCGVSNLCRHDEVDELCAGDLVCESGRGCVSSASCASDAECDDGHACTTDSCGVGGICNHTPVNARCEAGETCDTAMGCVAPTGACASDADCDDDVACTRDTCAADLTCSNTALDEMCDTAAGERCSATAGCFVPMPCTTEDDCQDGNFCNGRERCTAEFGCAPAEAPVVCASDSDDCTLEMCDPTLPNDDYPTQMGACTTPVCDRSRPECGCPTTGPTCSGRFSLPGATGNCLGALGFNWNFSTVQFTNDLGAIEVTGWTVSSTATVPPMADHGPACPNIDASTTLLAPVDMPGCDETYRIVGTFVDDDTFMGTFSATFTSFCAGCNMSIPVTGTRIP